MGIERILWLKNRLQAMGPAEILWRIRNEFVSLAQAGGFFRVNPVSARIDSRVRPWVDCSGLGEYSEEIMKTANLLLKDGMQLFDLKRKVECVDATWNRDPYTGVEAPLSFGKKMPTKNREKCGDVKYLWERGRFLQAVPVALAWKVSEDTQYLDALRRMVESWLDQCPYMKGVHWNSSLELGIRLINWALAWQVVGGADSPLFEGQEGRLFRDRWLCSIREHLHFINDWYSMGSSANNHLIGEAAGVLIACRTWPFWEECSAWEFKALEILENEACLQVSLDGVDLEQTSSYQQFVLDLFLLSYVSASRSFSIRFSNRIRAMAVFMAAMTDSAGNKPMIGDSDDGLVCGLSLLSADNSKSLIFTVGVIFNDSRLVDSGRHDLKATCLAVFQGAGDKVTDKGQDLPDRFDDGGYYIFRDERKKGADLFVTVDCGPLGYGSLAAHGHSDALSIYLTLGGREFLIDPGTYVYGGDTKWRKYFRGTSAHNTVRIDGLDQSVSGGSFLWRKHARTSAYFNCDSDVITFFGSHDGYLRLKDPLIHERTIVLDLKTRRIAVSDHLLCAGEHRVEQFWHFSEHCELTQLSQRTVRVENSGYSLEIHFGSNVSLKIVKGDEAIPLGWISRSFGRKVPCNTLVAEADVEADSLLTASLIY